MKKLIYFLAAIMLIGCKPSEKVVEALTGKILEPVTMKFEGELGEISVGSAPIPITVTITNNSSEPITALKMDIGKFLSVFNFAPDSEGMSNIPGFGGTCSDKLASHQSCTYKLTFNPRKSGKYEIPVEFFYQNLIKPDSKKAVLTAVTGEPAALVFTNDVTKYDFGVLEQTDTTERTLDLEIQNVGGLSAKKVAFQLLNTNPAAPSFRIISNDCPDRIYPQDKCKIVAGYKSLNNDYNDPEVKYSGKLAIGFEKDGTGKTDKLNAFFNFTSSTIEAKFSTNYKTIDFETVTVGNNLLRSIKISNSGYNIGKLRSINFHKFDGSLYATCTKGTGSKLDCHRSLSEFPFIINDKSGCFDKDVNGVRGATAGDNCFFDVTYWPSRTYDPGSQSLHDFDNSKLALTYDSQWLNKENIVTKNGMFDVFARFIAGARVKLDSIQIENIPLATSNITTADNKIYEANLGRLAKIADPAMDTFIKVTIKNDGESPATLTSFRDGAVAPHEIGENGSDFNIYYKGVKHSACAYIGPGASCSFSFALTPLLQGAPAAEDDLMYDNTTNPLKKFKKFIYQYSNGSILEDDGSSAMESSLEIRLISKLIAKGMLAFIEPVGNVPTGLINGNSYTKILNLKNVGTGDIYAISTHATNNLKPKGLSGFPYSIISAGTPILPATKDCKDLIFDVGLPLRTTPPDTNKFLAPGQVCALAVDIRAPHVHRKVNSDYGTSFDYQRLMAVGINGAVDIWERKNLGFPNTTIAFNFFDGDVNVEDPTSAGYGYLNKTRDINFTGTMNAPANIVPVEPAPVTSAVIARPAIFYPPISQSYPTNSALAAYSAPATYYDAAYFLGTTNIFYKSTDAITHVKPLSILNADYVFHIGTFKVGTTNYAALKYHNTGGVSAFTARLTEEVKAGSPISATSFTSMTSKPFSPITINPGVKILTQFKFAPTVAGTFSRCFDLEYDNRIGNFWTTRVCAYAEAVNDTPDMKVEYQTIDVAYDNTTGITTETPSGNWNMVTAPKNVPLNGPLFAPDTSSKISFTAVKGSAVYDLKLIRITNIGTTSAYKFNYSFLASTNTPGALPSEITTANAKNAIPTCTANLVLAVNASCEFYVKYKPIPTSVNIVNRDLGFVYDQGLGLNQFVSQMSTVQFNAIDPAKLVMSVAGVTSVPVTDWSNPTAPAPQSVSWPIDLKPYSYSNAHLMVMTANPSPVTISNIPISNNSLIKASFLNLNANPTNTWNLIYSNPNVIIKANKGCFYGDDETNPGIPANEKGFYSATTTANKCMLQVTFSGQITYATCSAWNAGVKTKTILFGGRIVDNCNPYVFTLPFYNYKRLSIEKIYLHMKGFIEPNRSFSDSTAFTNVTAVATSASTGSVRFSWPVINPNNTAFGAIAKYRIFYSSNYNDFRTDNLFYNFSATPVMSYYDTSSTAIDTLTIPNLVQGRYYFIKVTALRTFNHPTLGNLTYVSNIPNLPLLTVSIPNQDTNYIHSLGTLMDKRVLPTSGNLNLGKTACAAKKFDLNILGVVKSQSKSLINTTHWNLISNDPILSAGYTGDVGGFPHWLNDAAYPMKTNISLYNGSTLLGFVDYDQTKLQGNDPVNKVIYSKTCTNSSSCDLLNKVVGGDDVDLYFKGTYYTTATGIAAYHRCFAVLPCPTNTAKLITDTTANCPLP